MGFKSRGNWKMGMCFDSCQCRQCRGTAELPKSTYSSGTGTSVPFGIVVKTSTANDGSKFDKPISQTYYHNIQTRQFTSEAKDGRFRPSQYGTGLKRKRCI